MTLITMLAAVGGAIVGASHWFSDRRLLAGILAGLGVFVVYTAGYMAGST